MTFTFASGVGKLVRVLVHVLVFWPGGQAEILCVMLFAKACGAQARSGCSQEPGAPSSHSDGWQGHTGHTVARQLLPAGYASGGSWEGAELSRVRHKSQALGWRCGSIAAP